MASEGGGDGLGNGPLYRRAGARGVGVRGRLLLGRGGAQGVEESMTPILAAWIYINVMWMVWRGK